jgi:hypothetical protein
MNMYTGLDVYEHPDGGFYVIVDDFDFQIKMDDGRWEPAVLYRPVHKGPSGRWQYHGRRHCGTTKVRWADRFTKIGNTRDGR